MRPANGKAAPGQGSVATLGIILAQKGTPLKPARRKKRSGRPAPVVANYNPLLSPLIENKFGELPTPARQAIIQRRAGRGDRLCFDEADSIPEVPQSPKAPDQHEKLVELDSAKPGLEVVISAKFRDQPAFEAFKGKTGTLVQGASLFSGPGWIVDWGPALGSRFFQVGGENSQLALPAADEDCGGGSPMATIQEDGAPEAPAASAPPRASAPAEPTRGAAPHEAPPRSFITKLAPEAPPPERSVDASTTELLRAVESALSRAPAAAVAAAAGAAAARGRAGTIEAAWADQRRAAPGGAPALRPLPAAPQHGWNCAEGARMDAVRAPQLVGPGTAAAARPLPPAPGLISRGAASPVSAAPRRAASPAPAANPLVGPALQRAPSPSLRQLPLHGSIGGGLVMGHHRGPQPRRAAAFQVRPRVDAQHFSRAEGGAAQAHHPGLWM